MQFNIVIERDEDGRYVAECMDLPGCLSEGETLEEALENISEAILGCVKSRLKLLLEKQPLLRQAQYKGLRFPPRTRWLYSSI